MRGILRITYEYSKVDYRGSFYEKSPMRVAFGGMIQLLCVSLIRGTRTTGKKIALKNED